MSFTVELSKKGKAHIILNNFKYRESHTRKSGDVVWRCLGKSCGSSIITDGQNTEILASSGKHSGPHPVTMRSLTRTTPTASPAATTPCTPVTSSAVGEDTSSPSSPILLTPTTPAATDLETENLLLKDQLLSLEKDRQCILDHAVESDRRLLQYTDRIFAADTSRAATPTYSVTSADCAVQCELSPVCCRNERCAESRDLVQSLKTTIEVLEAEIRLLRTEAEDTPGKGPHSDEWTTVRVKKKPKQRRSKVIPNEISTINTIGKQANDRGKRMELGKSATVVTSGRKKANIRTSSEFAAIDKRDLTFSHVIVDGDSHARHLAGLVQGRVTSKTQVSGFCRPGARLRQIAAGSSLPPGGCTVLFAGANDIAAGEQRTIFEHLEKYITARLSSAMVVVSTIPHRHDLPADHPMHQQIFATNHYIEELCVRHKGAMMLDFNIIERQHFTRNGMHLRMSGKRLLAELIVDCLLRAGSPSVRLSPSPCHRPLPLRTSGPATAADKLPGTPMPLTLSYDSYADAVTSSLSSHGKNKQSVESPIVFLGSPLQNVSQKT